VKSGRRRNWGGKRFRRKEEHTERTNWQQFNILGGRIILKKGARGYVQNASKKNLVWRQGKHPVEFFFRQKRLNVRGGQTA